MNDMNARQVAISDILRGQERLDVGTLAKRFDVSEMTIRRDLRLLEQQGLLVRTHGGGVAAGKLRFLQGAFPHHAVSPQKAAIGKLAASLVTPGQKVMVDCGTTALEVARNLPRDSDITVATTSLCVVQELFGSPLQVLLFGGYIRKEFPSLYGPLTETMLRSFHVDILFIGCDGADSRTGFYTTDLRISSLEQEMITIADRVVVVTESIKFANKAFVRYSTLDQVHTLVTDSRLSATDRKSLEDCGIKVLLVGENPEI
jgi:DeoR family transcriptional regulator, aga operon transcriptional repressor